jgi:hypothetical protein
MRHSGESTSSSSSSTFESEFSGTVVGDKSVADVDAMLPVSVEVLIPSRRRDDGNESDGEMGEVGGENSMRRTCGGVDRARVIWTTARVY